VRSGQVSVDRKPAFWEYDSVKTTLDLPDELMHAVKIRAVHEHKKLKNTIAALLREGLSSNEPKSVKIPKLIRLRGGLITAAEIEAAINWDRD
jgi:hypothetical protein